MKSTFVIVLIAALAYVNAISFSDGTSIYVPRENSIVKFNSQAQRASTLAVPAANQVQNTFDGVVDRTNSFLFLFSQAGNSFYLTKVALSTFTVSQSITLPRKPVQDSVMADNSFVYWLDNIPNNENTTWVRVNKDDITGNQTSLSLIGNSVAVGPRPDPRAGSDINVDLVAYFKGPAGILQRTSTRTFSVITPIPIPQTQNIIHVQNGLAYDLTTNGNNKVVQSYTFETSSLNATTGSTTTITTAAGDNVAPLQEDRYARGFFHTVLFQNNADKRYIRHVDRTLVRSNQNEYTLANSAGADQLPRVDNGVLHYTSRGNLYVYNVADGTSRTAAVNSSTSNSRSLLTLIVILAISICFTSL